MKIYTSSAKYNNEDKYERIQGIIDYVNILFDGLYDIDEIPQEALQIYYLDYYYTQIVSNGHLHFFLNSHEDEYLLPLIFSGLKRIGGTEYIRILTEACEALTSDDEASIVKSLAEIDQRFDIFGEKLFELNYDYVSQIQDLTIVPESLFYKLMQTLVDQVPDFEKRMEEAQKEADSNEYVQLAIGICTQFNIDFRRLNGLDSGEELLNDEAVGHNIKNDIFYLHVDTSAGYHYIINEKNKATLVNGLTGNIVGAISFQ